MLHKLFKAKRRQHHNDIQMPSKEMLQQADEIWNETARLIEEERRILQSLGPAFIARTCPQQDPEEEAITGCHWTKRQ